MKHKLIYPVLVCVFVFSFVSCKKDTTTVSKSEALSVAVDDAIASDLYDDVLNETDGVVSDAEGQNYNPANKKAGNILGSRIVEVDKPDTINFPKVITITYSDWIAPNGRTKNGIVQIEISARMWTTNATRTVNFENFTINGYKIEGTKVVTYKGKVAGKKTIEVKLTNGKITSPDGRYYIERSFTRIKSQEAGNLTPLFIWDDVWSVTGTASGKSRNGFTYQVTIREPLMFKAICPWITQGIIDINIADSKLISIDFGDGICDKSYTVTIDGQKTTENSVDGQSAS